MIYHRRDQPNVSTGGIVFRPGILIVVSLALPLPGLLALACGGGSSAEPEPQDAAAVPTATLPNETPEAIIVASATAAPSAGRTYTVQPGDSPASIAAEFGTTAEAIMTANGITDPTALFAGQVLTIPGLDSDDGVLAATAEPAATPLPGAEEPQPSPALDGDVYIVQEGDFPQTIAAQFGITAEELMAANGITDPTSLNIGDELTIPAASGE